MVKDSVYTAVSKAVEASQRTSVAPLKAIMLQVNKDLKLMDEAMDAGSISPAVFALSSLSKLLGKINGYIDIALTMGKIDSAAANVIERNMGFVINELVVMMATNLQLTHVHVS